MICQRVKKMKICLIVPLVSFPFFAACSPAAYYPYNTASLKNINKEELSEDIRPEKVARSLRSSRKSARIYTRYQEKDISPARAVRSESVPVIDSLKKKGLQKKETGKAEQKKQEKQLSDFLLPSVQYTNQYTYTNSSGNYTRRSQFVAPVLNTPVQSKEELKEELTGLKKTGDWSEGGEEERDLLFFYGIQCGLAEASPPARIKLDMDLFSVVPEKKKKARQAEKTKRSYKKTDKKTAACDFPIVMNRQVKFYLEQFQNRQRAVFTRWLERAAAYLPLIEKELKKAELPGSLAYLAMIESGFNPSAYSPAQASGLWQFIPGTGRYYGLRIDSWVDERRDPEKSTRAAVSYLDTLYQRFGDWQLAVAAYNAGEGRIERGLRKYKAETFWELAAQDYLPLETKRYVPKLIAAIIIAHDPVRYGFRPVDGKSKQYDIVEVPSRTQLSTIASVGGYSMKKLRQLNNELLKNEIPPTKKGVYSLKIPAGSGLRIAADLEQLLADEKRKIVHRFRRGETLSGLSKRYNISVDMILQWNDIKDVQRIRAGRKLALYLNDLDGQINTPVEQSGQGKAIHYYKVRNGDSLWSIARKHQVSTRDIKRWNSLNSNMLHPGKKLLIRKG